MRRCRARRHRAPHCRRAFVLRHSTYRLLPEDNSLWSYLYNTAYLAIKERYSHRVLTLFVQVQAVLRDMFLCSLHEFFIANNSRGSSDDDGLFPAVNGHTSVAILLQVTDFDRGSVSLNKHFPVIVSEENGDSMRFVLGIDSRQRSPAIPSP